MTQINIYEAIYGNGTKVKLFTGVQNLNSKDLLNRLKTFFPDQNWETTGEDFIFKNVNGTCQISISPLRVSTP